MKSFTKEDLATYDGKSGRPMYVAFEGTVYDVSESKHWKDGKHMNRHKAGKDLTSDIKAAPHSSDYLERFSQVGTLEEAEKGEEAAEAKKEGAAKKQAPDVVSRIVGRFPILQRHPRPMVVHFPIVLTFAPPVFLLLGLLCGVASFKTTAMHCLGGAVLFTPIAILTGWFTWWLNYGASSMKAITIKTWGAMILFLLQVLAFVWWLADPSVVAMGSAAGVFHVIIVLLFIPIVSVVGWFGATLTFPVE